MRERNTLMDGDFLYKCKCPLQRLTSTWFLELRPGVLFLKVNQPEIVFQSHFGVTNSGSPSVTSLGCLVSLGYTTMIKNYFNLVLLLWMCNFNYLEYVILIPGSLFCDLYPLFGMYMKLHWYDSAMLSGDVPASIDLQLALGTERYVAGVHLCQLAL